MGVVEGGVGRDSEMAPTALGFTWYSVVRSVIGFRLRRLCMWFFSRGFVQPNLRDGRDSERDLYRPPHSVG